jgi:hypothetical protein
MRLAFPSGWRAVFVTRAPCPAGIVRHVCGQPLQRTPAAMFPKPPIRPRTSEDDPAPGTPGTGEDVCPERHGSGERQDGCSGAAIPCPRCDGTGRIIEGVGGA